MNLLMIFVFMFFGQSNQQANFNLTVYLSGIEPHKGNLMIGVFNNEEDFLIPGKEFRVKIVKAKEQDEIINFENMPAGKYAISIFQDRNADGKMNKNFIGIPKEIYGFSKNFRPVLSAPKFDDCSFELKQDKVLKIELK